MSEKIVIVQIVCVTLIILYGMSIKKSKAEKERAEAFEKMYRADRERKFRPSFPPKS